uniref:Copper transport protein n=1 Tax=Zonotrichia albicollis TaxID=44394 RepID=A0A8D2MH77_ZONAL
MMTFYFSDTVVLLFDFWSVHSPTGRLPALGYPSIHPSLSVHPSIPVHPSLSIPLSQPSLMAFPLSLPRWFWFHVAQTLFHVLQVVLGYMVMLAVMSYNAWIFLGAIAGSTLGYFMVYPLLGMTW